MDYIETYGNLAHSPVAHVTNVWHPSMDVVTAMKRMAERNIADRISALEERHSGLNWAAARKAIVRSPTLLQPILEALRALTVRRQS